MSEKYHPSVGINRGQNYWCASCGDLPNGACEHFPKAYQAGLAARGGERESHTKLLKIAAAVARREYLPCLERCRTIADARIEVARWDERHAQLAASLKEIFDELSKHAPAVEAGQDQQTKDAEAEWRDGEAHGRD